MNATQSKLSRSHPSVRVGDPSLAGRAIHLVDLENLVGGSSASDALIAEVWHAYSATQISEQDLAVVGTGPMLAARAWWLLPAGIRRVVGFGLDGGERSLIDGLDWTCLTRRFERIVIASGDHEFVDVAKQARGRRLLVHQVSGLGHPSRALLDACDTHSVLTLETVSLGASPLAA